MLRSYGGYTWTSEDAPPVNPESRRMLGLTALGIVGAAAGYGATRNLSNGYRGVDYIAAATRLGGNLSPFQLGNTFRIPEILSPYLSNQYRSHNIQNFGRWDKDFLKSSSTYDYLLSQTGLTPEELQARGINRGMIGGDDVAHAIEWTPTEGINGKLESVLPDGKRHLLSKDIALLATNQESVSPLNNKRGLNRYAAGVMGAADLNSKPGFDEADVFARAAIYNDGKEVAPRAISSFIPVASPIGELKSLGDLSRRTNLARGIASFEIGRFGHLVENVAEQFGGEAGLKIAQSVLPKSAPASHMFARYGMLTAAAGGLIIGNEQLDWIRRKGAVGNLAASAVVSTGASYAASRLGASSKTAFMVGAASFFGQNLLPGFNQGLIPGIATMGVNLDIMRGNALNPFGYQRRIMEGFAPGISDWKTGALLSVGAITMATTKLPGMRERLNVKIARAMNHTDLADIVTQNRNVRDLFYEQVGRSLGVAPENTTGFIERKRLIRDYYNAPDSLDRTRSLNALFSDAEESHLLLGRSNPLNAKLVNELKSIHSSSSGFTREVRAMFAHAQASFFGADLTSDKALLKEVDALGFRGAGKLGRLGMVGLAAFVAHGVLTGGLTGSMAGSDELRDIYSGKKMIEMRSSRAWEAGGTPFEGGNTKYYRPHAYALMMNRVREKGIWGENEDQLSPIGKWFTKNFTYDLEKQNYWSRPYPISNAAFSDVPIIGGVLGATIGKLIKPPKIMHAGDWMREGENGQIEFANVFRGSMIEPAYSLGAVGQGRPQTPFSTDAVHSDLTSQFRQLEGMTGWLKNVTSKTLFGSSAWSTDRPRLANSGEMTSWGNEFWESELGGMAFSNEVLRRIFPNKSGEIQSYNPITNDMPSWLPDRLHYGDIIGSTEQGAARLPGAGFAALHPELRGVDPEAYPLLYKYQILADVAPFTPEFFNAQQQLYTQRQAGQFTERETDWIDRIDSNRARVVNQFNPNYTPEGAIELPGSGLTSSLWRGARSAIRAVSAPAEYMIPMGFRPIQKLMGSDRDPIENYEYNRMYGTPLAFWDKPMRDWFRPAAYSAAHLLGYDGKPAWRAEADTTNEYFDKLEFTKYMQLAEQATANGMSKEASQYRWQASQTRAGINPNASPLNAYWSMSDAERPYFNSFAQTTNPSERQRILEMVPNDEARLYQTMWSRMDSNDPTLYSNKSVIDNDYLATRYNEVRNELAGYPQPPPNWIGYNEDVDLNDVKVRYIEHTGKDIHDFGMWESDVRKSEGQQFLDGSADYLNGSSSFMFSQMRSEVYNMLGSSQRPPQLNYSVNLGDRPYSHITYNDNRDADIIGALQRYLQ